MIGHSSTTLIPPGVLDLLPGVYNVEEPCLYCDDYSDYSDDDSTEPRAVRHLYAVLDSCTFVVSFTEAMKRAKIIVVHSCTYIIDQ